MRPQIPPSSPARPGASAPQIGAECLRILVRAADELVIETDLGGSAAAERIAAGLLGELPAIVAVLARERACGQRLLRSALEDIACQFEAAADRRGYWPLYDTGPVPPPYETQLRALIARLRLMAAN